MKLAIISFMLFAACAAQGLFPGEEESDPATPSPDEITNADNALLESITVDVRRTGNIGATCRTPFGEIGSCLPIRSCRHYFPLLGSLRAPGVTTFLRQRICSFSARSVALCCPSNPSVGLPQIQPQPQPQPSQPSIIPSNLCGRSSVQKVIRGEATEVGEFPWLVAVGATSGQDFLASCGGTLITVRHVLSAAHCFDDPRFADPTHVRVGDYHLSSNRDNARPEDFRIASRRSPGYNRRTHENDIEILILDRDVSINELVRPACLPFNERNNNFQNARVTVVGWGRISTTSLRTSPIPMKADVPVVDTRTCAKAYEGVATKPVVDNRHICAGDGVTDSCAGDSGGPLNYVGADDRTYVVGIVSFAVDCARKEFPGVYTNVASYLDWIQSVIRST